MKICDEFIANLERMMPEMCKARDLVKVGLFKSEQACAYARHQKIGPPYFKIGGTILYPRKGIVEYLHSSKYETDRNAG